MHGPAWLVGSSGDPPGGGMLGVALQAIEVVVVLVLLRASRRREVVAQTGGHG
jgi:hypothetical protein